MEFKKYITKKIESLSSESKKKVLFIDGQDQRAIEAAKKHVNDNYIEPILLLSKEMDTQGIKSILISSFKDKEQELIEKYVEKRKGKETIEDAKKVIFDPNFFAMLLLELNYVDGVIGGLHAPTANILRAAFKVIGAKKGIKTISSVMIMEKGEQAYLFGDISVNISPSKEQLVDIGKNALDFAKSIDFEEKIAFLSFSTSGSAVHERSTLVKEATELFNEKYPLKNKAIGEVQFDAAFSEDVRKAKYKADQTFSNEAKIFIFPSLEAGNIGYKIAQRMGNFGAIGPIITGMNKPVNDLSRGATVQDVYYTALLTAIQSETKE